VARPLTVSIALLLIAGCGAMLALSGLRAIGVVAAEGNDEYGTIGLDKHRTTEDWLQDSAAP